MYIFVFVFMLMGVLGLYTQIFTLQAAKQFARQRTVGEAMLIYHNASYALARANSAGVSLLSNTYCLQTYGAVTDKCSWGTLQTGSSYYNLPVGFNASKYAFPSVVYDIGGQKYLLTYVGKVVSAGVTSMDDVTVTPALGFTIPQIFQQMKNTGVSPLLYGMINGSVFTTRMNEINKTTNATYSITYPILSTFTVANGSVGFLSPL